MIQKSAERGFLGGLRGGEKNASAFEFKRKYVLSETQVRLG
jgi:hypothetical protein